jgi:excisionase family DNA binding protein
MNDDLLTTTQAAAIAGVKQATISKAIQRGQLSAGHFGQARTIERSELERWLRERRPVGRPRKEQQCGEI